MCANRLDLKLKLNCLVSWTEHLLFLLLVYFYLEILDILRFVEQVDFCFQI